MSRSEETGPEKLHRDENMENMVGTKGFGIFQSVTKNH